MTMRASQGSAIRLIDGSARDFFGREVGSHRSGDGGAGKSISCRAGTWEDQDIAGDLHWYDDEWEGEAPLPLPTRGRCGVADDQARGYQVWWCGVLPNVEPVAQELECLVSELVGVLTDGGQL